MVRASGDPVHPADEAVAVDDGLARALSASPRAIEVATADLTRSARDGCTPRRRIGFRIVGSLVLLPAVDVADGQAVQLVQGVAGTEKRFGDPRAAAQRWQDAGAEWLHLVDLDAAFGRGSNAEIIAEVASHTSLNVELSGGIRDDESLERALATGCKRVNIGTAALERPEWCEEIIATHGDKIAIGLDVRGTRLAARGWTREGGELYDTLDRLERAGCARYVVTDVASDGMLSGPNLDLLRAVCDRTGSPVVASGGISSLTDIADLAALVPEGVEGAIIGTALYVGSFTLQEALVAARGISPVISDTPPAVDRVSTGAEGARA